MGLPVAQARITSPIDALVREQEARLTDTVGRATRGAALGMRDKLRSVR